MALRVPVAEEALDRAVTLEKEGYDYFFQASQQTDNELAKRTFQALAARHAGHAGQIGRIRRIAAGKEPPQPRSVSPPRSMFDEIMRKLEQSGAPTAADLAALQEALTYAAKLRDVYAHLAGTSPSGWEHSLYDMLTREEDALKLTLADTLDYLRSNFQLSDLSKEE